MQSLSCYSFKFAGRGVMHFLVRYFIHKDLPLSQIKLPSIIILVTCFVHENNAILDK